MMRVLLFLFFLDSHALDPRIATPRNDAPPPPPHPPPPPIPGAPFGLVFFGMSMSQRAPGIPTSNQASVTHQTKFDLNRVQDRGSQYLCRTNDDGWLAGGGNGPSSFLIPAIDSSHMELVHPATLCSNVAWNSSVQPELSNSTANKIFITGAPLAVMIDRVRSNVAFDPIRVVPTGARFTPTDEYQLRFNPSFNETDTGPTANPTMTQVYHKLMGQFSDVVPVDPGDPFHISMARDTHPCSDEARAEFENRTHELTLAPWRKWAASQNGTVLNDAIPQYKDATGGFYLFVTRARPLIYFAPKPAGAQANGSRAYYCEWHQDGRVVEFANPVGGPVKEVLVPIPESTSVEAFISKNQMLSEFSSRLCQDYSYHKTPATKWDPSEIGKESSADVSMDSFPTLSLV